MKTNNYNLQLLHHEEVFATRELALKYLTDLLHQAQDNHVKTLQDCQLEMDRYLDGKILKERRNM